MAIERAHDVIDSGWFNILLGARDVCLFLRTGSNIFVRCIFGEANSFLEHRHKDSRNVLCSRLCLGSPVSVTCLHRREMEVSTDNWCNRESSDDPCYKWVSEDIRGIQVRFIARLCHSSFLKGDPSCEG